MKVLLGYDVGNRAGMPPDPRADITLSSNPVISELFADFEEDARSLIQDTPEHRNSGRCTLLPSLASYKLGFITTPTPRRRVNCI